uniref:F-box domain-containing protein n=1 Tax=Anopheles atroparvus TaxID=41427 RepID=A0AAG5DKZ2_ANOAO
MSFSILDLPSEVVDHIFSYLTIDDHRYARRVCRQWNHQLSSPGYFKATKMRLEQAYLFNVRLDELAGYVGQGKLHCLKVNDLIQLEGMRPALFAEYMKTMVQLLEVSRFSLEELRLRNCPEETLLAVYDGLVKACRLRHLRVDVEPDHFQDMIVPKVPCFVSDSVGLSLVTHLEVTLGNESFVGLVSSLASQLTCLTLTVFGKHLLLRCWNDIRLPALHSLSVRRGESHMPIGVIQPVELGGGCWQMLAQLETFRCGTYNLLNKVLVEMLQHCKKLQCLAITNGCISLECIEQIGAMKGLKDLHLAPDHYRNRGLTGNPPVLQLPNVEHLHLSAEIGGIRLGRQMPKIKSMVLEGLEAYSSPKALISEIGNIDNIAERRLRKFPFIHVQLDREANDFIGSLSVDLLTFENCRIDGSLLDVLAKPDTRRQILRIVMKDCTLTFQAGQPYNIRTVTELREKCPYIQIAHSGIIYK